MTFAEALSSVFNKYATFDGRARRREYWYWFLAVLGAEVVAGIVFGISESLGYILFGLIVVCAFLPTLAVGARRLHDTGRSAWWLLVGLIPFGGIVLLVFYLLEGDAGANQYGPSPKAVAA
jgi:uncharacterized membrane protein YhaH (DUF805 family)